MQPYAREQDKTKPKWQTRNQHKCKDMRTCTNTQMNEPMEAQQTGLPASHCKHDDDDDDDDDDNNNNNNNGLFINNGL